MGNVNFGQPSPQAGFQGLQQNGPDSALRIGIIGAHQSGKSTMMRSLQVAIGQQTEGRWRISALAGFPGSHAFLADGTRALLEGQRMPEEGGTLHPSMYGYRLIGHITYSKLQLLRNMKPSGNQWQAFLQDLLQTVAGRTQQPTEANFELVFWDYPGGNVQNSLDDNLDLVEFFATCHGLIFLFDADDIPASTSVINNVLPKLVTHLEETKRLPPDHLLTHSVAICLSKFDKLEIFQKVLATVERASQRGKAVSMTAFSTEILDKGEISIPYVSNVPLVVQWLGGQNFFTALYHLHEDRIGYFLSSAVGFNRDMRGEVKWHDTTNVRVVANEERLQSAAIPLNILEPFVWIYTDVQRRNQAQKGKKGKKGQVHNPYF